MSLTIGLTQLKRKKRKDGTIPIYIRITENRKSRYRSTGISVKPKYWLDSETFPWISSSHSRSRHFNMKIKTQLNRVHQIEEELYKQNRLSMEALLDELSEDKEDPNSLIGRAKSYHNSLEGTDRFHEWKKFGVLLNNLQDFLGDSSLTITEVDAALIEDFQDYLLDEVGNNPNTVRRKLQSFKGMFLRMLKNKEIKHDPFAAVDQVSKQPADRVKLSLQQIRDIESQSLEKGSELWHIRNYFLYSFYNAGIRFSDTCRLRWGNIVDGRLTYQMQKTGGKKSIKQLDPMYRILFQYVDQPGRYLTVEKWDSDPWYYVRQPDNPIEVLRAVVRQYGASHKDDYIFPLLDKEYDSPFELRRAIGSCNARVNLKLKDLAGLAGIEAKVSFHVSRHSFANYANKKGMDLYSISKALAHSDLKTTQQYLDGFDEEKLDKSMNNLFEG